MRSSSTPGMAEEKDALCDWVIDCPLRGVSPELRDIARGLKGPPPVQYLPVTQTEINQIQAGMLGNARDAYHGANGHWCV